MRRIRLGKRPALPAGGGQRRQGRWSLERFTAAHKEAKERLLALKKNAEGHLPQEEMGILEAHLLMIDDPML
ncbi:phosphoenolpyruvate-utilizing N-terminal domain-containing protein, partial [Acetomicrobium sp. S15 = DSM 107314]|uniref:phosphoenolpyruvate-utilizing N-terminal domain-containing protein n=1 Tax=Acetomicrobium sp. S15 = DSM 107314 TaxID=2529858 RepID=UPI0018E15A62